MKGRKTVVDEGTIIHILHVFPPITTTLPLRDKMTGSFSSDVVIISCKKLEINVFVCNFFSTTFHLPAFSHTTMLNDVTFLLYSIK